MGPFIDPVSETIKRRYSCRVYEETPIAADQAGQLESYAKSITAGPFGAPLRFELVVATEQGRKDLKGLGTYGAIKDPPGFIIGAAGQGEKNLEDFGYGMETIILCATGIGLGSCWIGGNFTKSSFARKIGATPVEVVPAVAAVGYASGDRRGLNRLRQRSGPSSRLPWSELFFQADFEKPLSEKSAGAYAVPLEMLRLAPSSHNYQPWRIIQDGPYLHFFLQRTRGYGPDSMMFRLLGVADLQRIDIGIAMCHFELAVGEFSLQGKWEVKEPSLQEYGATVEYVATWVRESE